MQFWVARPQLYLPARLQRQIDKELDTSRWQRHALKCIAAGLMVVALTNVGLYMALHGHGKWSIAPLLLSGLPLLWLVDKAMFQHDPEPQADTTAVSNLPGIIVP